MVNPGINSCSSFFVNLSPIIDSSCRLVRELDDSWKSLTIKSTISVYGFAFSSSSVLSSCISLNSLFSCPGAIELRTPCTADLAFSFNWSFGGFFQQIKISSQLKFQWTNGTIRYGMESTIHLIQWCVIFTTPSRYLRQIVTLRVLLKKIIWTCLIKYFMAFKWIKPEDSENLTKSQKHIPSEHPEGLLFSLNLANHNKFSM